MPLIDETTTPLYAAQRTGGRGNAEGPAGAEFTYNAWFAAPDRSGYVSAKILRGVAEIHAPRLFSPTRSLSVNVRRRVRPGGNGSRQCLAPAPRAGGEARRGSLDENAPIGSEPAAFEGALLGPYWQQAAATRNCLGGVATRSCSEAAAGGSCVQLRSY